MFNVEYSLVSDSWVKRFTHFDDKTIKPVLSHMAEQLKLILSVDDVTLMYVENFTYAIWSQGDCAGFVTITDSGQFISQQRTRLNKVRKVCVL